jgi:anion-transporting  ArsA/GET3 family ATPase
MVDRLLSDDGTAFVLIAAPKHDTVDEAEFFAQRLADLGIAVKGVIVNRLHPLVTSLDVATLESIAADAPAELHDYFVALIDLTRIATAERELISPLSERVAPAPLVEVPFLPFEVHDLATLQSLGDHLFGRGSPARSH